MTKPLVNKTDSFFYFKPGFYLAHGIINRYYDNFEEYGPCRNKCIFCITPPNNQQYARPFEFGKKKKVILCFGEPTRIKGIIRKIGFLKTRYSTVCMMTNGDRFQDERFAKELIQQGLDEVVFSLHGDCKKIHDRITGKKGAFDSALRGIGNAVKIRDSIRPGLKIGVTFIPTRENLAGVFNFVRLVIGMGIDGIGFSIMIPLNFDKEIYRREMPSYSVILSTFEDLIRRVKRDQILRKKVYILKTFPFCVAMKSGLVSNFRVLLNETDEFSELRHKAIGSLCHVCLYNKYCEGIFQDYADLYGMKEFKPIVK
jgi:MoaA/NifB/PqqE/SkfB family radical SAM enzyme